MRQARLLAHLVNNNSVQEALQEKLQQQIHDQVSKILLPYLVAFDRWRCYTNPSDSTDADSQKAKVVSVTGGKVDCFLALAFQLAPLGKGLREPWNILHQEYVNILRNLHILHCRHVVAGAAADKVPKSTKENENEWATLERGDDGLELPTGVLHMDKEGWRWSLYVPECYSEQESYPIVLAMHGGSGRGDDYLLSWLATARSNKCFIISPKSLDRTWGLTSDEQTKQDAISLLVMLHQVTTTYKAVDCQRIFCTGMSDGGTFSYILVQTLPAIFAGMAAAAAYPVPNAMSAEELQQMKAKGVPVHHVHGAKDWMFDIEQVRAADAKAGEALGAGWRFTELADWTHASPENVNRSVIWPWFNTLPKNSSFDGDFLPILKSIAPAMFKEANEENP